MSEPHAPAIQTSEEARIGVNNLLHWKRGRAGVHQPFPLCPADKWEVFT